MFETLQMSLLALGSFVLVALAAKWIGQFFSSYGLPYITGYLLAGMLAGPFVLGLMETGDTERLRFVDEVSLAVIAFIAGSELYIKELRSRLRPIMLNTVGIIIIAAVLIGVVLFIATNFIPFTRDLPVESRVVVAMLGAVILMALSPASTIAVIQEVRARGDFTKTVLSITVVMDVIIIILFAIAAAIAAALLSGTGLNALFLLALVIDLALATLAGVVVGKALETVLSASVHKYVKIALVLLHGLGIFVVAFEFTRLTKEAGFELHIEPLLTSMIAGFYVTNFTRFRDQFEEILHDVSPVVYVAFFALTGVALKLDILIGSLLIALVLFLVRMGSIFIGSYAGATVAGEPKQFRRLFWLGLITQAGIALGLAREVAVEFPSLGDAFATLIISVVVLNEIFGPLLLKVALRRAGEAHEPGEAQPDELRHAVILGVEPQSMTLARELAQHDWDVKLADTNKEQVERLAAEDVDERYIEAVNLETLSTLITPATTAVVAMLEDDEENYQAVCIACENFGVKRMIVRLNDLSRMEAFEEIGALVVNPTSAMVNLLDQYVRNPQSASLLMHGDQTYEIAQVTVSNPDVNGLFVRDLRLPTDVLILGIARNGHSLVPNGYTAVHTEDEVVLIGSQQSLQEVTLKLGY